MAIGESPESRDRGDTAADTGSARRRARAERDGLAFVLTAVRSGTAETRQAIERQSGLGRAVVADRLATLIDLGLVEEGDLGVSTGGRAPRQVRFRADAGHLLVASLGTTTMGVGLADLAGRLLVEHHEPADVTRGAETVIPRIEELFDWMLQEHEGVREIWGIGLALPGAVELAGGSLSAEPVLHVGPGWDNYPVRERLEMRFSSRVFIDSEVHLMALGELLAGRGVGASDLLFLKVGTGISAVLCSDGKLHRGAHGYAGDIGHVAVSDDSQVICRCGNRGCLEALAAGAALAREGQRAAEAGDSKLLADIVTSGRSVSAADVGMAAHFGDPVSVEILARAGQLIGGTVATLVNADNPSYIVVGGGVAQAGEILLAAIREAIYSRSRSLATRDLHIVRSDLGKTAGLMGAAFAVADELFRWERLRTWIGFGTPVGQMDGSPPSIAKRTASKHGVVSIEATSRTDTAAPFASRTGRGAQP